MGIGVALAVEDVELEGVERRRRQQKKQDRAVLDADPMTHDEPSGCGPQMGETHGPASGLLPLESHGGADEGLIRPQRLAGAQFLGALGGDGVLFDLAGGCARDGRPRVLGQA